MADDEDPQQRRQRKQLWDHRYDAARQAGLADPDAVRFADSELDTHDLTDLTDGGCEPVTALRILLR